MFSQTVLTVSQSDSLPEPDTNRWGESENEQDQTTTDSDQGKESTEESKAEDENMSEEDYEEWKEDQWYYKEEGQDNEQHLQSKPIAKDSSLIEEQDANQSSSVEPTWRQWRQKTEQELSDEWKAWEETNQGQSTQAYRHGYCQICAKHVSTTNINPKIELTYYECRKSIAENEGEENVRSKRRLKKAYKDDEEV